MTQSIVSLYMYLESDLWITHQQHRRKGVDYDLCGAQLSVEHLHS